MINLKLPEIFILLLCLALTCINCTQEHEYGNLKFQSSDKRLNEIFEWAKGQALFYVRDGDPVGKWYEASLPGRDAFCMRDVSHQSKGACYLGLQEHTKNMLQKFTASVSSSRDWCGYWEINKYDLPAPVDYHSDEDFWYNLPANFDIMNTCWNMYQLTGDRDYILSEPFTSFHQVSVTEYPALWDTDLDGIMDSPAEKGIRGLASYYEAHDKRIFTGADLYAAQANAYHIYSMILNDSGNRETARKYAEKSDSLKSEFSRNWWDEENRRYYSYLGENGSFGEETINGILLFALHFDLITDGAKQEKLLSMLMAGGVNVEENSYLPSIFYRYGMPDFAYKQLLAMSDPSVPRRDYPEVSYAVIETMVEGLMGIQLKVPENLIVTCPQIPPEIGWTKMENLPWKKSFVTIGYEGNSTSQLFLADGESLTWKICFRGDQEFIWVNGGQIPAQPGRGRNGEKLLMAELEIIPGQLYKASLTENPVQ